MTSTDSVEGVQAVKCNEGKHEVNPNKFQFVRGVAYCKNCGVLFIHDTKS